MPAITPDLLRSETDSPAAFLLRNHHFGPLRDFATVVDREEPWHDELPARGRSENGVESHVVGIEGVVVGCAEFHMEFQSLILRQPRRVGRHGVDRQRLPGRFDLPRKTLGHFRERDRVLQRHRLTSLKVIGQEIDTESVGTIAALILHGAIAGQSQAEAATFVKFQQHAVGRRGRRGGNRAVGRGGEPYSLRALEPISATRKVQPDAMGQLQGRGLL